MKAETFKSLGLHITFQINMRSLIVIKEVSESLEDTQTSQGERMIRWEWKSCNLNKIRKISSKGKRLQRLTHKRMKLDYRTCAWRKWKKLLLELPREKKKMFI